MLVCVCVWCLVIDEIDLRSTTSAADVNQTDTAGQRRQRTPVTAAGDKSSNTSRFVEKTRSWWKSGHHQPSGLPSRLHPPGCLPPTYIHTQPVYMTSRVFFGPTRVHNPNGISIGSAVFVGLTIVTDRQTDHVLVLIYTGRQ